MGEINYKELIRDSFENMEKAIYEYVCQSGREITIHILEELDIHIKRSRDKSRYKYKQIRRTTIKTVYGEVEYNRTQYYDTIKKEYVYLLDEEMQMEKVGTISSNLAKQIVNATINMPYRKAAEVISKTTGQSISSHGAWNVTQKIGRDIQEEEEKLLQELRTETTRGEKETKVLFQEADGVYINIQANKQKAKSQEIKLATIYEGWDKNGKRLYKKKVYAGIEPAKEFNMKTEALIQSVYNIDETELRVLNGDGAAWIKNTYDPERIYQLDRFHVLKEIRRCIIEKNVCKRIVDDYMENNIDDMFRDIQIYIDSIDDGSNDNRIKLATYLQSYLSNNIDGLMPWQKQVGQMPEAPEGVTYKNMGVQENQNCSLVTMRMKGRKMRWSVAGGNNLVKLIYMKENGELDRLIEEKDSIVEVSEPIDVKEVLSSAKVQKKIGKGSKYVEVFNTYMPLLSYPKKGTSKLLRCIQNTIQNTI